MNQTTYLSIIVYTVLQGLVEASKNHPSEEVRDFAIGLLEKTNYETTNWNQGAN